MNRYKILLDPTKHKDEFGNIHQFETFRMIGEPQAKPQAKPSSVLEGLAEAKPKPLAKRGSLTALLGY